MNKQIRSSCAYCGTGCGILVEVEDNRILRIEGDPDHPANHGRLCSKGRELHHTVHTDDRLLYPQMRTERTADFTRTDWDTALDEATKGFARIIKEHGSHAVAFYVSGQLLTEGYYLYNKLMKGFIGSNNIDTNSRLCMASVTEGYKRAFGVDAPPACYEDIDLAGRLFLFGANPAYAHPIIFRRMEAAKEAKPDMKVVVVDPRRTDSCSIADLHLAIKPGTDVPLLQAMFNVLMWENMLDLDYIAQHTSGFEQLMENTRNMTPRKAAEICGVSAADIVQAAHWFGEGPSLSCWTMGLNQSTSGTDKNNAVINLHLATGQIGKSGCGPFSLTGQPNAMGGREVGGAATMLAAHRDPKNTAHRAEVADYWGVDDISDKPGLTAIELFKALEEKQVKAVWIVGTNPMVSLPDAKRAEAALKNAELVVVSDIYHPTDTTQFADILLPAAGWAEKDGTVTNSERRIAHIQQAVEASGECWPDWKIVAEFAVRLGDKLGQDWSKAFAYDSAEAVFNEHRELTCGTDIDITGLSYALLDEQGPQQWPYPEGAKHGTARLYTDGKFYTEDGKAHFIDIKYRPVAEPTDADYPLSLTSGRIRDQWHTMTKTGQVPQLMQHDPVPKLTIHPNDAEARGLSDAELVRVFSRRGHLIMPVHISCDIREGVVFLPMHWGSMTAKAGRTNTLTQAAVDPISKEPEFKHTAVQIEAYAPAWRGVMLMAGHQIELGREMIEGYSYGTVACIGRDYPVTWVEMACYKPLIAEKIGKLDQLLERDGTQESLEFTDHKHGIHKRAWLDDGHLAAVRWVGDDWNEAEWLKKLMLEDRNVSELRPYLLAPGGPIRKEDNKGKIICACQNVGELELKAAIESGSDSIEKLKSYTLAGTGCGSCVPEMKRLLS